MMSLKLSVFVRGSVRKGFEAFCLTTFFQKKYLKIYALVYYINHNKIWLKHELLAFHVLELFQSKTVI